ncbi:S-type anion channel SLAH1-like [Prosopis cineraria]|uniref:S-type anion channel SLAH1-like n=1 Tax=Prosopis cineraria TaxID=364024 RepID=UPI00240EF50D|nr:S-type anion channel SLAH1-like [Prosopis cineraria]
MIAAISKMAGSQKDSQPHIVISVGVARSKTQSSLTFILTNFHAGYFRISLSLSSQALLWKILKEPIQDAHALRRVFSLMPSAAFTLLWSLSLLTLLALSLLYLLRCFFHFNMVKDEFLNRVGVNYLFAPWISFLLLLESTPFLSRTAICHQVLWCVLVMPVLALDLKIYGQYLTKGKRHLATVGNPTSQLSVIGNLVGAQVAAGVGWRESAVAMFGVGMAHYLVLFVTLYQRLSGEHCGGVPVTLRPVLFLFFAAPSVASLAWGAIIGHFDSASKMLFFLSLFLFMSLITRPMMFKKAMRKFDVAWWAYSFPLTALALASAQYAEEVKGAMSHALTLLLSSLSVLVSLFLMVVTVLHTNLPFY